MDGGNELSVTASTFPKYTLIVAEDGGFIKNYSSTSSLIEIYGIWIVPFVAVCTFIKKKKKKCIYNDTYQENIS